MEFDQSSQPNFKVYKWRFVNLALLCACLMMVMFQSLVYAAIGNVTTKFYQVSYTSASFTALTLNIIAMLCSHPLGLLAAKLGYRETLIWCTFLNAFGACIKCFSIKRSFVILIIGQIFVTFAYPMILILISVMVTTWFNQSEFEAVQGITMSFVGWGWALSFLTPLIFKNTKNFLDVNEALNNLSVTLASITLIIFLFTLLLAKDKPNTPPSRAEQMLNDMDHHSYVVLFKNINFILLMISCGLLNAIDMSMFITLNQSVFDVFQNGYSVTTIAGVLLCFGGILGISYPVEVSIASGLTLACLNLMAILSVPLVSELITRFGAVKANLLLPFIGM
ncbi:putative MFS-type transporter -like protein, partial [Dinothrombium tinctorium]